MTAPAAERGRSRSPRRGSLDTPASALAVPASSFVTATNVTNDSGMVSTVFEISSQKLGQLLGLNGVTIQKIKETTGVMRLHIQDKDKAKRQPTIHIEVHGSSDQVAHCSRVLESVCNGDQTELGHLTTYVHVERGVLGKLMGHRGQTIKELTQVTGCYVEIQQDTAHVGSGGTPRLFIAGAPELVDTAVKLVENFIASPQSRLEAVLGPDHPGLLAAQRHQSFSASHQPASMGVWHGARPAAQVVHPPQQQQQQLQQALLQLQQPQAQQQPAQTTQETAAAAVAMLQALAAIPGLQGLAALIPQQEPQRMPLANPAALRGSAPAALALAPALSSAAPAVEVRVVEVSATKKGHLLGLHGQTIDKIRQVSGVRKCHLQEGREAGNWGSIHVEIVGTADRIDACERLIHQVVEGDHSGIGHATDMLPIEVHKISRLMGHRGQVVTLLKDLTGTYLDIQQGPCPGVPAGEAQIFMAGPVENIAKARILIAEFLRMMDLVPASGDGGASLQQLGLGGGGGLPGVLASLSGAGAGDPGAALAAAAAAQAQAQAEAEASQAAVAAAPSPQQAAVDPAALQQLLAVLPQLQAQLAAAGAQ